LKHPVHAQHASDVSTCEIVIICVSSEQFTKLTRSGTEVKCYIDSGLSTKASDFWDRKKVSTCLGTVRPMALGCAGLADTENIIVLRGRNPFSSQ